MYYRGNQANIGERYRNKFTGRIAEVLNVTGTTVFMRWEDGVNFTMSSAQFIRIFTYHVPRSLRDLESFERDEFEGIRIGHAYTHKNDYRRATVKSFYEKYGVVFVSYVWSDDRKSGARPVQSFKDTFEGFQWVDYEHYVRPGWRFVDKDTGECVTVLHLLDDGDRIKFEYIKKAVKRTVFVWDFWQQFRPYAGREAEPMGEPKQFWIATIFDVNSASIWDTKVEKESLDNLTTLLDREIPGYLEQEQGIKITIISYPSGDILYPDYIEAWQEAQGKPSQDEIFDFIRKFAASGVPDFDHRITNAVLNWKPINIAADKKFYIPHGSAWRKFRETLPAEHWIDRVVAVDAPKKKPRR